MSSTALLAPTVQAAGGTTVSAAYPLALDAVIQCECVNPGSPLLSPCLVSLLLSGDGGVTFCPVETRRFESTATTAFATFTISAQADKKVSSATVWFTASGAQNAPGNARTFKPPWTHFALLFSGNLGASVTVSAIADGASVTSAGLVIKQYVTPATVKTDAAALNLDWSTSNQFRVVLSTNTTITNINESVDQKVTIKAVQAASGGPYSLSCADTVAWHTSSFSAPSMPSTAGADLYIVLICTGTGTYDGFTGGASAT
jgi:hypothetical protein